MRCGNCGQEEPEGGNFCARCGTPLMSSVQGTTMFFVPTDGGSAEPPRLRVSMDELQRGQGMLITVRGPGAGRTYVLEGAVVSIGRSAESDIVLDDMTVSRHHAELFLSDDTHVIKDAGSRNGVFVNREAVSEAPLTSGDELQVGRYRLVYFSPT